MATVVVVQHAAAEGLGRLGPVLEAAGLAVEQVGPEAPLPAWLSSGALGDQLAGLVVLGGPMGVADTDRYPRLADERALIERALRDQVPVLGICLGSQLLAATLGARVYRGPQVELGWLDVTRSDDAAGDALVGALPAVFPALHWHGDVFDLPAGAVALARSEQTRVQAFRHGELAWGLLFHLEADTAQVRAMCDVFGDEVAAAGLTSEALLAATVAHDAIASRLATALFTAWAQQVRRAGR